MKRENMNILGSLLLMSFDFNASDITFRIVVEQPHMLRAIINLNTVRISLSRGMCDMLGLCNGSLR